MGIASQGTYVACDLCLWKHVCETLFICCFNTNHYWSFALRSFDLVSLKTSLPLICGVLWKTCIWVRALLCAAIHPSYSKAEIQDVANHQIIFQFLPDLKTTALLFLQRRVGLPLSQGHFASFNCWVLFCPFVAFEVINSSSVQKLVYINKLISAHGL